jgi:hypothetical protein
MSQKPYSALRMGGLPTAYVGDRHDPDADLFTICAAIVRDLEEDMPGTSIRIVRRVRVGSRTIDISVIGHPQDLSKPGAAERITSDLVDHAMRYGWDRSSYAADLVDRHFGVTVGIDPEYWGARQNRKDGGAPSDMTPSAFMKAVRSGDVLEETVGERAGRRYRVVSTSGGRFVTDDGLGGRARMAWHRPHASCLRVAGDRVRIATGSVADPDSHHDLIWSRIR